MNKNRILKRIVTVFLCFIAVVIINSVYSVMAATESELKGPEVVRCGDTITLDLVVAQNNVSDVKGTVKSDSELVVLTGVSAKKKEWVAEKYGNELVFYDITASAEGRALFTDILCEVAKTIFIPLTVGGGINTVEDFDRVLKCGADKVSVNSGAIRNPDLIREAARKYGDQCVVLSVDAKRVDGVFRVFAKGGRENTGMDAIEWIKRGVDAGAGEIVLNSIDTDGVKQGFDLEMLDAVCRVVDVPVIASGGAGCKEDFVTLFQTLPKVDAGLAASIFHFGEVSITDLKQTLVQNGIPARI